MTNKDVAAGSPAAVPKTGIHLPNTTRRSIIKESNVMTYSKNETSRSSDLDVLICGAGAAGLTLATDLARRGVDFRLIEKQNDPFRGSRGKGIQPRTQEVFEDLGIIDRVVALGGLYPPQREYRDDGTFQDTVVVELPDPTPAEPYHTGRNL